jgi:hypothetical protein
MLSHRSMFTLSFDRLRGVLRLKFTDFLINVDLDAIDLILVRIAGAQKPGDPGFRCLYDMSEIGAVAVPQSASPSVRASPPSATLCESLWHHHGPERASAKVIASRVVSGHTPTRSSLGPSTRATRCSTLLLHTSSHCRRCPPESGSLAVLRSTGVGAADGEKEACDRGIRTMEKAAVIGAAGL